MSKTIDNLTMLLAKNAVIKHLKMERQRILQFIDTVHVENRVAVGYTQNEIDGISGDILCLVIDAGSRISDLEKDRPDYPRKYIQKRSCSVKSFYEQPMPGDEIGTTDDLEFYLSYEWNNETPPGGNSPILALQPTIGINTGNTSPHKKH